MADRAEFTALLTAIRQHPERRAELEAEIYRRYGRMQAVLAVDLCGFTELTHEHGVVYFLALIEHMRSLAAPAIEAAGGRVVESKADNLLAVFESVEAAVAAARTIMDSLQGRDDGAQPCELYASIGIGYGRVLLIAHDQVAGSEVNLAFKLGEDVAEKQQILLTTAAATALTVAALEARAVEVGGIDITCYALQNEG